MLTDNLNTQTKFLATPRPGSPCRHWREQSVWL